jgi:acid phosphatase class B
MKGYEKMNIGIDIDDTITNSSDVFVKYAQIYNETKNINMKLIKIKLLDGQS